MDNVAQEKPISAVPHGNYAKWGYGTFPTPDRDWDGRIIAAKNVLDILDGNVAPQKDNKTLSSISIVRGMFQHIYLRDSRDWFTMSRQLGFPSSAISRPISSTVRELGNAIVMEDKKKIAQACNRLRELPVPDMLDHYLDVTVNAKHPIDEKGFAFILWSESRPGDYWVGATPETFDEVFKTLKREYPDRSPYGVVGSYLVDHAKTAQTLLDSACGYFKQSEPGFYRASLDEVRSAVETVLKQNNQFLLSPWHGEEPEDEHEETASLSFGK